MTSQIPDIIGKLAARRQTRNYDVQSLTLLGQYLEEYLNPIGTVVMKVTETAPSIAWQKMDGRALSKVDYPDLYEDIGGTFGETETTFNLPDMTDRYAVGVGAVLSGQSAGSNTTTLTVDQIPEHNHSITDPGHSHSITDPGHTHTSAVEGTNISDGGSGHRDVDNGDTGSATTGIIIDSSATGITLAPTGSGEDIDNRPLSTAFFFFMKVRV